MFNEAKLTEELEQYNTQNIAYIKKNTNWMASVLEGTQQVKSKLELNFHIFSKIITDDIIDKKDDVVKKVKKTLNLLKEGTIQEKDETIQMKNLLFKKNKTKTEKKFILNQLMDLGRFTNAAAMVGVVPGGGPLFLALNEFSKKYLEFDLTPSSFQNQENYSKIKI